MIDSFDDCLAYVHRLGVCKVAKGPGWIPDAQKRLCDTCNKILAQTGQDSWYQVTFRPFFIHYVRATGNFITFFPEDCKGAR